MTTTTIVVGETRGHQQVRLHVKKHSVHRDGSEVRLMRGNVLEVDITYVHDAQVDAVIRALSELGATWCDETERFKER